ncbi:hypothetical protein MPSEU_000900000 [Mayamaea pseudoterrestris]|nr:hypothetical protein MPSEU_000900000 [Mayamaea pseudoterrestris]
MNKTRGYRNYLTCLAAFCGLIPSEAFGPRPTPTRFQSSSIRGMSSLSSDAASDSTGDIYVMVNGMPGPMATAAAEACLRKNLKLAPTAMTGPDVPASTITVTDLVSGKSTDVRLVPANDKDELIASLEGMRTAVGAENLLAIDYTHPSAVNDNARFYVSQSLPFVMGTTGGDRDALLHDVHGHFCVIAPNMGKQIVAMQAALEDLANKYPAAFKGYKLSVVESHQKTKADTSGTAKAVIASIKKLAADEEFSIETDIEMIRDELAAMEFGVPEQGLNGHAFHTYTLTSPDGSVQFQLQHNVVGRTVYAEGTADGIKFLAKKMQTEKPQVYSMINVLEEGALE